MSLCTICSNIPWQPLRDHRGNDEQYFAAFSQLATVAGDSFQWCDGSGHPVGKDKNPWPYIRHSTDDNAICRFCYLVTKTVRDPGIRPTYHGGFKLKRKNFYGDAWKDKSIWTQLPGKEDDRPLCRLWVGSERPEHFVRTIETQVTFDSQFSHSWPHVILQDPFALTVRKQLIHWLARCDNNHAQCRNHSQQDVLLPTRILDLGALPTAEEIMGQEHVARERFHSGMIRLVETGAGDRGKYAALSYCWGNALPCKTTAANLKAHMSGLNFTNLPRTLQESIMITRVLGLQYIWIDCLCIIQDDKRDWEIESACMGNVYSQSYLAIAATRARHCEEGILGMRKKSLSLITFANDQKPYNLYFQQRPRGLGDDEEFINQMQPLQRRAWVFQERILALRTLHFSSDQLYWECADGLISEDGYGSFDPRDTSFEHSLDHIAKELIEGTYRRFSATKWASLVRSYMALDITYSSDRLPALSGIVATLQNLTGDVCYAGLWAKHFMNGLLWYPHDARRPDSYRAPSWSFAALDGRIEYFVDLRWADETTHYVARLEECDVTPIGQNPLGELKSGFVKIIGPLTAIKSLPTYPTSAEYWNRRIRMRDGTLREAMARFDFKEQDLADVLMITTNVGLLIHERDGTQNEWERVGIVEVMEDHDQEVEFQGFEPNLSASSYPPTQTIILV